MTTTEQTLNEIPKKNIRLSASTKRRIAELETEHAQLVADDKQILAEVTRTKIERLAQGLPEEREEVVEAAPPPPNESDTTADEEPKVTTFAEAAAAAAEHEANRIEWDVLEETIDVKLSEGDLAGIARANAADDQEKTERQRKVDDIKERLKEEKAAIDTLVARMHDRHRSVIKGEAPRRARWKVGTCFATNTVVYHDPDTDAHVYTRAIEAHERQVALPLPQTRTNGQLALGDADPTDMNDPDSLLAAAQAGEASPSNTSLENEPDDTDEVGTDEDTDGEDEEDDA